MNVNSASLVAEAALRENLELLRFLLEKGADATRLGPGKWAKDPVLADLLLAHGADVNRENGAWIWVSCTGNNGQRDDPEFVEGLIRHGVKLNARHRGRMAVHFAARAGFTRSLEVLLKHGADVNARDRAGETPLFTLFTARKRADVIATLKVLLRFGADLSARKGSTN